LKWERSKKKGNNLKWEINSTVLLDANDHQCFLTAAQTLEVIGMQKQSMKPECLFKLSERIKP
jgi:hypothetical protein